MKYLPIEIFQKNCYLWKLEKQYIMMDSNFEKKFIEIYVASNKNF